MLGQRGVAVAHCPTSNAALGSGLFPLGAHLTFGVRVALGSDVGAGTGFSLFKEGLQAYFAQQLLGLEGHRLTAGHLLHLATAAGADALGLAESTGDLSVGKEYDALWLRPEPGSTLDVALRHADSPDDALAKVFALAGPADVRQTWVAGTPIRLRAERGKSQQTADESGCRSRHCRGRCASSMARSVRVSTDSSVASASAWSVSVWRRRSRHRDASRSKQARPRPRRGVTQTSARPEGLAPSGPSPCTSRSPTWVCVQPCSTSHDSGRHEPRVGAPSDADRDALTVDLVARQDARRLAVRARVLPGRAAVTAASTCAVRSQTECRAPPWRRWKRRGSGTAVGGRRLLGAREERHLGDPGDGRETGGGPQRPGTAAALATAGVDGVQSRLLGQAGVQRSMASCMSRWVIRCSFR